MPLQFIGEHIPEMWVRLDKTCDIGKIFEPLALPSPGFGPGLNLAFESILKRSNPQKNAMNVSSDGTGREISVEILRAELKTDRRMSLKVDGPFEFFAVESHFLKQ